MSRTFRIVPTTTFQADVQRLEEHIIERELQSHAPDDTCLLRFLEALERSLAILTFSPHTCRRSESHRELRELIVPFGHGGCIVLFAIQQDDVLLLAARDQHEHDYR